jgi:hypothetical protein
MLSLTLLGAWRVQGRIMYVNGVCGCYKCDSGSSMTPEGGQCYQEDACPAGQQLRCPERMCGCYDAPEGGILGEVRVQGNYTCPTAAHIILRSTTDPGIWCVKCPDGKTVWEDHMSSSIKCSDHHSDHMTAVAPTAKVRATFSNVLEPDSVPSSAAPQYADAIVEDCTGTDWASCEGYCRGDDPSLAAAATEDATAVLNQTRLTPESILASTAPEEATPTDTDKPASGSCWGPPHLGSDYCWHDTENRMCGEGEAGCSCICRKCPDGYMEDRSNGQFKCNRCLCPSSIGVCGGTSVCLPQPRGAMPWGAGRVPFDGYSALSLPALSHPPAIRALPPLPPPPFSTTYSAFFLPGGPATGVPPAPTKKAASAFPWAAPLDRRDIAPTTAGTGADAIRIP